MGKRSDFARVERDFYPTPVAAVAPLFRHICAWDEFIEPCAGDGALIDAIESWGLSCVWASDIAPRKSGIFALDATQKQDWETLGPKAEWIITNPPWDRKILHTMIENFIPYKPTWLLFDADWAHTKQAAPYLPYCQKIVSVGRVKWIEGSAHTGKDNCAWYLFDNMPTHEQGAKFYGRGIG